MVKARKFAIAPPRDDGTKADHRDGTRTALNRHTGQR